MLQPRIDFGTVEQIVCKEPRPTICSFRRFLMADGIVLAPGVQNRFLMNNWIRHYDKLMLQ